MIYEYESEFVAYLIKRIKYDKIKLPKGYGLSHELLK